MTSGNLSANKKRKSLGSAILEQNYPGYSGFCGEYCFNYTGQFVVTTRDIYRSEQLRRHQTFRTCISSFPAQGAGKFICRSSTASDDYYLATGFHTLCDILPGGFTPIDQDSHRVCPGRQYICYV